MRIEQWVGQSESNEFTTFVADESLRSRNNEGKKLTYLQLGPTISWLGAASFFYEACVN